MISRQGRRSIDPRRSAALLLAAALLALAPPARADRDGPDNAIVADVGLHVLGLGYQRTVSNSIALQVALDWYEPWTQNDNLFNASPGYQSDLQGYVLRARPIFYGIFETPYPAGGPPTGFYFSPFGQFGIVTATRDGLKRTGHAYAVGFGMGWAWLFFNHITVLVGGGAQYHVANIPDNQYVPSFSRIYPEIDANLGFAF
jgi:hypothetical protein